MTEAQNWIKKTHQELLDLVEQEELDSSDAWRGLVLVARLFQSPFKEFNVPLKATHKLTELKSKADEAAPDFVLEHVAETLDGYDEPGGMLLDAILEADDTVSVLWLMGYEDEARDLSYRTAGLIELSPRRVLDLVDFATMRLDTIQEEHIRKDIWESIEAAPGSIVTQNLFPLTSSKRIPQQKHSIVQDNVVEFPKPVLVPQDVYRAAASSLDEDISYELEPGLWLSRDGENMVLEYRPSKALDNKNIHAAIIVSDRSSGQEILHENLDLEKRGKTFYASLGSWDGRENLLQRLLTRIDQPQDTLNIRIHIKGTR